MEVLQFIKRKTMKHSFTQQDIQRYGSTGHIPRGLYNLTQDWHYAAFKRIKRIKDGK